MGSLKQLGTRDILGMIYQELDQAVEASWVKDLVRDTSSDQETETYKMSHASPAMREWTGGRQAKNLGAHSYALRNRIYEATLAVDVEDLRRDKTGQIRARIQELAPGAVAHWEDLIAALIVAGGSAVCADGQYFFDDDHSTGDSGTQKNLLAYGDVAELEVTTTTAPTPAECAAAILGVIGYMLAYKDESGRAIHSTARRFRVLAPYNSYAAFAAAAKALSVVGASGAVSANPVVGASDFNVDVSMVPGLATSASAIFYMARTDGRGKPFIRQEEVALEASAIAEGSELEFLENTHLYGVKAVRAAGYGLWANIAKATFH